MDNQNAKKNGLAGIAGDIFRGEAVITSEEDVKKATDASGTTNAEDVVIRPQNYENVQTQSVVETAREQAEKELAQIKAYNEEMLRRQKIEEGKDKAKRSAVKTGIIIFVIVVLIALGFLIVNIITNIYRPPAPTPAPDPVDPAKLDVINGYKCTTTNCRKIADMPDGRIILRDELYYVYDSTTGQAVQTNIENQEYYSVTAFNWGNDIFIDLDHESGLNGIFSVNDNRMITGFNYDSFIHDINDESYKEMTWIEGQYIIGRKNGDYRLIRISDGKGMVRGTKRVFIRDNFCFGYFAGGERRAYTLTGKQIKAGVKQSEFYVRGDLLIYVQMNEYTDRQFYDGNGEEVYEGDEYNRLTYIDLEQLAPTLNKDKNYYRIPAPID